MPEARSAILYRMVLPEHTCPFGLRAKAMLEQAGFDVDDRILSTRDEVEKLKDELGVRTTPQIFIGEKLIGGSEDLEAYLVEA